MPTLRKRITSLLCLLLLVAVCWSQYSEHTDSLRRAINHPKSATDKAEALKELAFYLLNSRPDSALYFGQQALAYSKSIHYAAGEVNALNAISAVYSATGNPDRSLEFLLQAIQIAEQFKLVRQLYNSIGNMGTLYMESGDYAQAKRYYLQSNDIAQKNKIEIPLVGFFNIYLSSAYLKFGQLDSALYYVNKGYNFLQQFHDESQYAEAYEAFGNIYALQKKVQDALSNYYKAIEGFSILNTLTAVSEIRLKIAHLQLEIGHNDSALYYAKQSLQMARQVEFTRVVKEASSFLTDYYKSRSQPDSAFVFAQILMAAKDSLYSQEKLKRLKDIQFTENIRQQEEEASRIAFKNRVKLFSLAGIILVFIILVIVLLRNNRQKQKAYNLLRQQKAEIDLQKEKADKALQELKAAQSQLVHAEKMASLGELTAGIAHEIQNPLNFVNNFSDVNAELIEELKNELTSGNQQSALEIAEDIKVNEQKINHHGKRADSIVKGMLQHSRTSTGQKEPTDINALCDEYLRLAYHGLRAKDKSFNAQIETDFDPSVGKINAVSQDLGRVILNLINNAFYAAAQQAREGNMTPVVKVITKRIISPGGSRGNIEIRVIDNGPGIPEAIRGKIFQPFFTTKPTGQGTGLGLSLSYDIVVKGHSGELKLETAEGQGTSFIIALPIDP
jgi:signal transduction histidine kinase